MKRNTFYTGNSLDVLRTFPDNSVHACVTSPPYFGLRRYHPGEWVGGDPKCEHEMKPNRKGRGGSGPNSKNTVGTTPNEIPANVCTKCGAVYHNPELGIEETPEEYVKNLVEVCMEVHRVLRADGSFWLVIGDSFASNGIYIGKYKDTHPEHTDLHTKNSERYPQARRGTRGGEYQIKAKDLIGIPWRVALALQSEGWYIRRDIVWAKGVSFCQSYAGSCMPEPVRDRPISSHEYVFLLTKSPRYYYDHIAVKEPIMESSIKRITQKSFSAQTGGNKDYGNGSYRSARKAIENFAANPSGRNLRSVWTINPKPFREAHFGTFPPKLIEPIIRASTSEHGCCAECGAPYRRVVVKGKPDEDWKKQCGADSTGEYSGQSEKYLKQDALGKNTYTGFNKRWKEKQQNASDVKRRILAGLSRPETVTWEKTCSCSSDKLVPAIVLDPFSGAGTTALVALQEGRDFIGIELNPDYVAMSERRVAPFRTKQMRIV